MKQYKEIKKTIKEIESIICDICSKKYDDIFEIQEFHSIDFVGGYGSIFGDGTEVKYDICQHCLYKIIKNKRNNNENNQCEKIKTYFNQ